MDEKAIGKSISFRPAWVYKEAVAYGLAQEKKQKVSEVVCGFVVEGLMRSGWVFSQPQGHVHSESVTPAEAKAIAELRRMGIDPVVHLEAILADAAAHKPPEAA